MAKGKDDKKDGKGKDGKDGKKPFWLKFKAKKKGNLGSKDKK